MHYFASMTGVPVFKIYLCLVHIETKILKLYPDYFGKTIQESKAKTMKKGKSKKKHIHLRCNQSRLC